MLLLALAAGMLLWGPAPARAASQGEQTFRALLFTKTTGFRHDSIPAGVQMVRDLAANRGFAVDHTEDSAVFNDENLARYDVVVFLQTSGNEVLSPEQEAAFQRYVYAGGGTVGVHSAYFGVSGMLEDSAFFHAFMGGEFRMHGPFTTGTVRVEDPSHPATAALPASFVRTDEWYTFYNDVRKDKHVLLNVDSSTTQGDVAGVDRPVSWCSTYKGGRQFYTAMGHAASAYAEPFLIEHIYGAMAWAAGVASGDCGDKPPTALAQASQTDGVAPLRVAFASEGSEDHESRQVTYAWTFGDGSSSTAANPIHTYTSNGVHTARLAVTDGAGNTSTREIEITVGNRAPGLSVKAPPDGGIVDWDELVEFSATAWDPEDGTLSCGRTHVASTLLHTTYSPVTTPYAQRHGHGLFDVPGCSADARLQTGEHAATDDLRYELKFRVTDNGAAGDGAGAPPIPPLTTEEVVTLRPRVLQGEWFTRSLGVAYAYSSFSFTSEGNPAPAGITDGDWVAYDTVNLKGIDSLTLRVQPALSATTVDIRLDSPTGRKLGSAVVPAGPGPFVPAPLVNLEVPIENPGGTHELFLVFDTDVIPTGPLPSLIYELGGLFLLDSITFNGPGALDEGAPEGIDADDGEVGGDVPPTLSLSLGAAGEFGAFTPAVARDYTTSLAATVVSTAGVAALSVADPSTPAPGRLVNGPWSLPQPLQVKASSAKGQGGGQFAALSASSPLALLGWADPVSNDAVTVDFKQSIGASDPLRTGRYSKTLVFTLSTTAP